MSHRLSAAPFGSGLALLGKGTWTVMDQGLFAVANFGLNVLLARWVSPEAYGAFTVAYFLFLLVGAVYGGLFTEPMLVYGAGRFRGRMSSYLRALLLGHGVHALGAGLVLGLAAAGVALAGATVLAEELATLAVAQAAILFLWTMRRACYVVFHPQWAAAGGVVYLVIVVGGALALGAAGWLTGPLAFALMGLAALVVGVGLAVRLGVSLREPAPALRREVLEVHQGYGRWASMTAVLEWLHGALPFLVLPFVSGLAGSAVLRALYNLAMPAMQAVQALTGLAVPLFVHAREGGRLRAEAERLGVLLVGGAALYGLVIGLLGEPVMGWLYGGQYEATAALRWLVAAVPVTAAASGVLMAVLRAQERPRAVFGARVGAVGAAATGGVALTSLLGVPGAVASDLLAYGAEAALMGRALRRGTPVPRPARAATPPAADAGAAGGLRVLVVAYACSPGRGSEPGVGWGLARALADRPDVARVAVVAYAGFRAAIERELAGHPAPRLSFHFTRLPVERARHWREGRDRSGLSEQVHYYLWQGWAAREVRRLCREAAAAGRPFDVIHHATLAKYWAPSAAALGAPAGVPVVWGPVGGGEAAPASFLPSFSWRGRVYEGARRLAQRLAHVDPLVRHTARRAHLDLATTDETAERMRALGAPSVEVACAVALSDETMGWLGRLPLPPSEGPARFVSVGRMLHWKGFALGVEAFARAVREAARDGDPALDGATFTLYGDGPERRRLLALARRLGVADRVHLPGQIPRERLAEALAGARALVHPSLHDSGGYATLEAAAAGRPVVCLGLGGPALQVAHGRTGYVVAASTPAQAVEGLARALRALAADPARARAMGAAGRQAARAGFRWALQGERALTLYRRLLAGPSGDGLATAPPALEMPAALADPPAVPGVP
jgi:glycosyltransferase involved in cell wall biosynthesis/O-antigen/teichoic acid export membrane protein